MTTLSRAFLLGSKGNLCLHSWEQCCLQLPCSQGKDKERGLGLSWKVKLVLPPPRQDFLLFLGCVGAQLRFALLLVLVKSWGIKQDDRGDRGQTPASPDDDKHQWLEVSAETGVCLCEWFNHVLNLIAVIGLSGEVTAAKHNYFSTDLTLASVLIWRQHGQHQ